MDREPEELPTGLIDALRAEDRAMPMITSAVDREMTAKAAAQFASRRRAQALPGWLAAAAAAVTLAVALTATLRFDGPAPLYADIDGSGRIDIADVMAVARAQGASAAAIDAFAKRVVTVREDA